VSLRGAAARLLALVRGRQLDRELDDEILAHLELAERDAIAAGLSREEARTAARRRFGGIELMKETHRDRRSFSHLGNLVRDFRYGFTSLGRQPGFAAIAIGVLAIGIGANVAMFGIVDAVLLKPLPFAHPDRIVRVWEAPRLGVTNATSTLDFLDWKRMGTAFDALAAEIPATVTLLGNGEPARLSGKAVTGDYFRIFSTAPLLGRTFASSEDQPGAAPVVVLSHAAWQSRFGGDPQILSRRIILDGESHQIIGVLPAGAVDRDSAEFWKPLVFTLDQFLRGSHWLMVHGRLREGVTLAEAREQMRSIHAALLDVTPVYKRNWSIMVEQLDRILVGDGLRQSILIAFGAVLLVLLIACANVANLLLARGATRTKEIAIRAALGASRGRLLAQFATESMALCLLGGAAGLALALLLIRLAAPFIAHSLPYPAPLELDYRLFAFAAAIALGVALLVGTLPSLQTSAGNLEQSLRQAGRGSSGADHGLRRYIVVAEVALSLVLVCGALLLLKSLFKLQQIDTGVRIENIITVSLDLPAHSYPVPVRAAAFYEAARERVRAIPGVLQAALATHLPLRWISNGEAIEVPGVAEMINVRFKRVDPGYFNAFGIPLLAGRGIQETDRNGARRVMVINEALARRLADAAGIAQPVGRVVRLHCPRYITRGSTAEEVEIAGVIRSERVAGPGSPDPAVVYVPLAQVPTQGVSLIVRTQADPSSIVSAIREAVRGVDPDLPLGEIATMQEVRDQTLTGASRPAWLIGAFAAIAAFLTAIGLYGVLSQAVARQRREIGIRMALGAHARDVVLHVLRNGLTLVVIGLVLGTAGAVALTRVMKNLLFQVSPLDPFAIAAACLAMTIIGLLAGFIPAARAARVDPVTTLRDEG
jgi:predicted permease